MKKFLPKTARLTLFAAVGILLIAVAVLSFNAHKATVKGRPDGSYRVITDTTYRTVEGVEEYSFSLDAVNRADMLALYINHYEAQVYLDGECVYSAAAASPTVRTLGNYWALIPLSNRDEGKEVRISLTPVYGSYSNAPEIYLGEELAIYRQMLYQELASLLLSLFVFLIGLLLLSLAVYQSVKRVPVARLYAIGLLAFSAGLWRLTYGKFLYLLVPNHTVFLYTLSILSLMLLALAMLNSIETEKSKTVTKAIRWGTVVYAVLDIVQLSLQLTGVLDLRQTLKLTHITIIVSAVALCVNGVATWRRGGKAFGQNYSWLIGIGALVDLLLYYFTDTGLNMLFTLGSIVCFSLLESFTLITGYSRQKTELEEMETQLTLSRTATMMSQIRSHFVFNILNAISGMCKYDPEKADDTVVRFARYLRNNIGIMEDDRPLPFSTELAHLEDYVLLEQVRFGDRIEFSVDTETESFMLPPLILQPIVENAIKHGLSKKPGGGTVCIATRDDGKNIRIIVTDDGVGFEMSEPEREGAVGLKNIRYRLRHLVRGTLEIDSHVGVGTTVTITIPKEEANA